MTAETQERSETVNIGLYLYNKTGIQRTDLPELQRHNRSDSHTPTMEEWSAAQQTETPKRLDVRMGANNTEIFVEAKGIFCDLLFHIDIWVEVLYK